MKSLVVVLSEHHWDKCSYFASLPPVLFSSVVFSASSLISFSPVLVFETASVVVFEASVVPYNFVLIL